AAHSRVLGARPAPARRALGGAEAGGPGGLHRMDPGRPAPPPAISRPARGQGSPGGGPGASGLRLVSGPLGGYVPNGGDASMPRIEQYEFGRIRIDGEDYSRDVILLPDRVVPNWWRRDGHALVMEDLDAVQDQLPERLVVGTGADGRMRPDPQTLQGLRSRGTEVEALSTPDAVRRYGELDPARTAAALHLTC